MTEERSIQRSYYQRTAEHYDATHVSDDDEHYAALEYIYGIMSAGRMSSVLDIGSGTGRAVRYFLDRGIHVEGVEPVTELIEQAVTRNKIPDDLIRPGSGEALPFASSSFDAVCEFAVLHHVRDPRKVVSEMLRVARRAVFLSDSNRFGQGRYPVRVTKFALYKVGAWPVTNWIKTRGRGYILTEGDGLSYSYSVYDSLEQVAEWADHVILIGTDTHTGGSWFHPLLTSGHVLLCGIRDK